MVHHRLIQLFERHFGAPPTGVREIVPDGSQRRYFRMLGADGESAVGALGPDHEENRAFLSFSRSFREAGLRVPEVYGADEVAGAWVMEDLGDATLFSELAEARTREGRPFPRSMVPVYERVLEELPRLQVLGGRVADFAVAYPRRAFDRRSMLWDLNYFKYHFLKLAHVPFNEARLERDFGTLIRFLLQADMSHFMYRDFQSRNVMLRADGPWFIDYQGGRRGALQYDLASLLYDAKAAVPHEVRDHLLDHYLHHLSDRVQVDRERFRELFRGYVLIRIMQAMGAFGYRGFFERKSRFLQSVPFAARNLAGILEQGLPMQLPELATVFERIVDAWSGGPGESPRENDLTVHLQSFSYASGYPEDPGGHGGGFVFDCRAIPNPGRLPEYAGSTGRDPDVVAFIEPSPEAESFWTNVRGIVDAQIQDYLRRGFTSLSVAFGCTGGQHRSVYFAERMARHLAGTHPAVKVELEHREAASWPAAQGKAPPAAPEGS